MDVRDMISGGCRRSLVFFYDYGRWWIWNEDFPFFWFVQRSTYFVSFIGVGVPGSILTYLLCLFAKEYHTLSLKSSSIIKSVYIPYLHNARNS